MRLHIVHLISNVLFLSTGTLVDKKLQTIQKSWRSLRITKRNNIKLETNVYSVPNFIGTMNGL